MVHCVEFLNRPDLP